MKALISLSGGLDSATVLARSLSLGRETFCIGFNYGSKHNVYENKCAKHLAAHYGVPFELIDLTSVFESFNSNLLKGGGDIPDGHYEDKSMALTVVPGRNMIFSSILAARADSLGIDYVTLGIHAGDHAIYPDCRPDFFNAMADAVEFATDGKVELLAPYLKYTKEKIIRKGLELDVPYRLTRTCYKEQEIACGKCGSCRERLEAFNLNKAIDPLQYEK